MAQHFQQICLIEQAFLASRIQINLIAIPAERSNPVLPRPRLGTEAHRVVVLRADVYDAVPAVQRRHVCQQHRREEPHLLGLSDRLVLHHLDRQTNKHHENQNVNLGQGVFDWNRKGTWFDPQCPRSTCRPLIARCTNLDLLVNDQFMYSL